MIYLIFFAIYETQNADNTGMLELWFDDKLLDV